MAGLEITFLILSLVGIIFALVFSAFEFVSRQNAMLALAREGNSGGTTTASVKKSGLATVGSVLTWLTIIFITATLIIRGVRSGHAPFSNMYEFAVSFAWGVVAAGTAFQLKYKTAAAKNIGLIVALLLLIFALVQIFRQLASPEPLVPALQQSTLLSAHVASAVVAYGTFTIGFGAAILYLVQSKRNSPWLPGADILDTMSYQSVVVGFPFLTLLIVLGALWANVAWGKYWSWDPKETASLVTWLLYAAYIHARVMRGWRGSRAAILLIIGFAAVLMTFFGNYIFSGLHAYG
jgi:cytochrome c-type biogenesis protein CcsB